MTAVPPPPGQDPQGNQNPNPYNPQQYPPQQPPPQYPPQQPQPPQQPPQQPSGYPSQDPYSQNPQGGYQPYQPGQYSPPPQAPQQYQGQGSMKNTPAKISMILGIVAFLFCSIFTGIPALILGIIGLKKSKELGGEGSKEAKIGIGFGVWSIVGLTILIVLAVTGVFNAFEQFGSGSTINSSVVTLDDISVTNVQVEVEESGVVSYDATVNNLRSESASYDLTVKCEGGGETLTEQLTTSEIPAGGSEDISATIQFNPTGSFLSVFCQVEDIAFGS